MQRIKADKLAEHIRTEFERDGFVVPEAFV